MAAAACSVEAERGHTQHNGVLDLAVFQTQSVVSICMPVPGELFGQQARINRAGEQHTAPLSPRPGGW